MQIQRTFSGAVWETKVGYCRAVKVGNQIYISGTAPIDTDGNVFAPGDGYAQAKRCLEIIQKALQDLDADIKDIVRTRMFVTDISRWEEFGKAHQEFFAAHPPVTSMIEIKSLVDKSMLIEIEAEAIIQPS
ncbi:MAG TPA: RidA family protein [Nostocaceae cyanobacterium]|nr:RidA family protein [Nostocaceae cyanobacterium]